MKFSRLILTLGALGASSLFLANCTDKDLINSDNNFLTQKEIMQSFKETEPLEAKLSVKYE